MKLDRGMVVTGLACLALAAAYLPPAPSPESYRDESIYGPERRLALVRSAYDETDRLLRDLRLRDSLGGTLQPRWPNDASVAVHLRGDLPQTSQQIFRAAIGEVWRNTIPVPGARLLVVLDAATNRRSGPPTYVLPGALDGRTCAVTLTVDWETGWLRSPAAADRRNNLQPWLLEALGPCLYYGAFGRPGPQIQAWLEERRFVIATAADWKTEPKTVSVRDDPQTLDMIVSDMSFDGLGCTGGDVARCQPAVVSANYEGATRVNRSRPQIAGVFHESYWPRSFPFDYHYLASLVREMGRDRFSQFWSSRASVDTAFVAAFGQPMDQWTAHWTRTYLPDFPPLQAAPRASAVFFGLGVGIIVVALSLVYIARRQVS